MFAELNPHGSSVRQVGRELRAPLSPKRNQDMESEGARSQPTAADVCVCVCVCVCRRR